MFYELLQWNRYAYIEHYRKKAMNYTATDLFALLYEMNFESQSDGYLEYDATQEYYNAENMNLESEDSYW